MLNRTHVSDGSLATVHQAALYETEWSKPVRHG